jgi:primosomal protein N'
VKDLAEKIGKLGLRVEISSPTPAFTEKVLHKYRWQLVIKSINRQLLVDIIRDLPAGVNYDIDPSNLL